MPRQRRKTRERRPAAGSEDVSWLLGEPFHYESTFQAMFSKVAELEGAVTTGISRGFAGMSFERSPLTAEDIKWLPHWSLWLKELRRLRNVYDDLPEDLRKAVPDDRKGLLMAVDENNGDPKLWWDRKREEQAEIDKKTGRKEGQLFSARTGKPYYVKELPIEGKLRGAARKRAVHLRAVFEDTPEHIRIRVPEAWVIMDVEYGDDTWDALLEHYKDLDVDRPFQLSYRSDAVEYTIGKWCEMEPAEHRAAVHRESEPIRVSADEG